MNATKYFFQGFLFVFGLHAVPFLNEVKPGYKISTYWAKVSSNIQNVFYAQTSKKAI